MSALVLELRTPNGLLIEQPIEALVAEDRSGWFGVRPGRADLVAALPPGLLTFRSEGRESFVALSGGLLHLQGNVCRVLAREAAVASELAGVAGALEENLGRRRERQEIQRDAVGELAREALRRLAREGRRR